MRGLELVLCPRVADLEQHNAQLTSALDFSRDRVARHTDWVVEVQGLLNESREQLNRSQRHVRRLREQRNSLRAELKARTEDVDTGEDMDAKDGGDEGDGGAGNEGAASA